MIEFFSTNVWLIWVIISIICLILELSSGDFFILCFAIGSAVAAIVAALVPSVTVQIITFAVVSALSLLLVRPALIKKLHKPHRERLSNAEAMIGRKGRVTEDIEAGGYGRVAVDGDDWKALSADGNAISKGTRVRIVKMDSIIATVEPINE
ncbi:MAG: NfeD family protein [Muribaculaceae bacterium]|nr:NfeD family protein [Muribaculaceae bacterium]